MDNQRGPLRSYGVDAKGSKYELRIRAVANDVSYYELLRDGNVINADGRSRKGETDGDLVKRLTEIYER